MPKVALDPFHRCEPAQGEIYAEHMPGPNRHIFPYRPEHQPKSAIKSSTPDPQIAPIAPKSEHLHALAKKQHQFDGAVAER